MHAHSENTKFNKQFLKLFYKQQTAYLKTWRTEFR